MTKTTPDAVEARAREFLTASRDGRNRAMSPPLSVISKANPHE
jgi:hypothetical protein